MLNKQEAFNLTWEKFVVGMAPQAVVQGECVYRLNGKPGCSVGLLIPDELYTPELEGKTPTSWDVFYAIAKDLGWSYDDREWLSQLQFVHDEKLTDEMTQPERVALYTKFAQEHGLKVPEAA